MRMKNKRGLIVGIMTALLALVCLIGYIYYNEKRFILSCVLLIALSVVNFTKAFSKKGILEELAEKADERDLYLVMRTSHLAIKAMTYILCAFEFVFLILYGINKYQAFIIIAGTLCVILILMFIVYLGINIYLEKYK